MEKKKNKSDLKLKKKLVVFTMVFIGVITVTLYIGPHFISGEEKVEFFEIEDSRLPADITNDVIPEYKTLERALACIVDDDIYVIVTRGEKPTSGFTVEVDKMVVEEEDDKSNLIVYASFEDPESETPISQIITYPLCVVKTDLKRLPDTIELRIQY